MSDEHIKKLIQIECDEFFQKLDDKLRKLLLNNKSLNYIRHPYSYAYYFKGVDRDEIVSYENANLELHNYLHNKANSLLTREQSHELRFNKVMNKLKQDEVQQQIAEIVVEENKDFFESIFPVIHCDEEKADDKE